MTVTFKWFSGLRCCCQNLKLMLGSAFLVTVALCKEGLRTFDLSDCSGICDCVESNVLSLISVTLFLHSGCLTKNIVLITSLR